MQQPCPHTGGSSAPGACRCAVRAAPSLSAVTAFVGVPGGTAAAHAPKAGIGSHSPLYSASAPAPPAARRVARLRSGMTVLMAFCARSCRGRMAAARAAATSHYRLQECRAYGTWVCNTISMARGTAWGASCLRRVASRVGGAACAAARLVHPEGHVCGAVPDDVAPVQRGKPSPQHGPQNGCGSQACQPTVRGLMWRDSRHHPLTNTPVPVVA